MAKRVRAKTHPPELHDGEKYNDQYNQPVNNVFDFYLYSPELFNATTSDDSLRNLNSDGQIILSTGDKEKTLVIYDTYNPAPQCLRRPRPLRALPLRL